MKEKNTDKANRERFYKKYLPSSSTFILSTTVCWAFWLRIYCVVLLRLNTTAEVWTRRAAANHSAGFCLTQGCCMFTHHGESNKSHSLLAYLRPLLFQTSTD